MKIFKFLRGKIVYRRVGPMMYKGCRTDKEKIEDDWRKVNADMRKAVEKYERKKRNRSFDYDEKHDAMALNKFNKRRKQK